MGKTDWDLILSVNAASLTDDEIEDLFPTVVQCEVDEIDDIHNLRTLMKLSQEILQYKDNQVESLLLECGELKEAINTMKRDASKRKRKDRMASDMKQEEGTVTKHSDLPDGVNHEAALQGKNEKIKTLMSELENLDKENVLLKERLTIVTQEMEDATEKMNEMTEELSSVQLKSTEYRENIVTLERENMALLRQIEEITNQQIHRDKVIDEFGMAIDARITEWKAMLDEKDAEITNLKENLSQSLMQSVASAKEQSKTQIVQLNEEIDRRDKIIVELQTKLSEAVVEINEGATLIEKLRTDIQKTGKDDKQREQTDLLKKLQDANEKISALQKSLTQSQEDERSKDSKICEILATLHKYEDENEGLTQALNEIKELKVQLNRKSEHIEDLISIVNKLEMLNSYQEMEIVTLREKLGIPEDESISIQGAVKKRKEASKKMEELMQQNKILVEENLELKSDIRTLKYKLSKSAGTLDFSNNTIEPSTEFLHSTKLAEADTAPLYLKTDISELKRHIQLVIEENEALRTGMHEILDSIRNQDGKSTVEIQSNTLERLLEALDIRHLAGWYHPAMRLQEHLNVIQGSNAELRSQIKQMRTELQRKDDVIKSLVHLKENEDSEKLHVDESESEKITFYISEIKNLQSAYQNEAEEWEQQKNLLIQQIDDLKIVTDKQKVQLDIYEKNWQVLEEGEDEIKKAYALKIKECVETTTEAVVANRKISILQQLLDKESAKSYRYQKDAIDRESNLKNSLADSNNRNKLLECEISTLQSNLRNSTSILQYNGLKENYEGLSIRYHAMLENKMAPATSDKIQILTAELELIKKQKDELADFLRQEINLENEGDMSQQLKEAKSKELLEKQRADHATKLHEISQAQMANCEKNLKETELKNSDLQEKLIDMNRKLNEEINIADFPAVDENKLKELQDSNTLLKIEIDGLKRNLQVSQEEARMQYSLNSLKTLELDDLRHQILDLQAISEDKATISRLDFELTSRKASELELNARKVQLENDISCLQEELARSMSKCEEMRNNLQDCRKQCGNRCKNYLDIISFLQTQYAGATSLSSLERIVSLSLKLEVDRQNIDIEVRKAKECQENAKLQQEIITHRLEIVDRLKDILEHEIGSDSVQDVMQTFSEHSQHVLSDFKYKRKIAHLEYELEIARNKFAEYESLITNMERDMINIQRAWSSPWERRPKIDLIASEPIEKKSVFISAIVETRSAGVQTDPYVCCLEKKDATKEEEKIQEDIKTPVKTPVETIIEKSVREVGNNTEETDNSAAFLNEQLSQALKLASERSAMLIKLESQVAQYQAKVDALKRTIEEKDSQLATRDKLEEPPNIPAVVDCGDKLALKSTVNSLQKIITQKEETISRYQNLLKEDRDEHSKAASRLQEEIKTLHDRILIMQNEAKKHQIQSEMEKPVKTEEPTKLPRVEPKNTPVQEEEIARLQERISTLEADLSITKELSERWHRLAEERLKHIDRMRERLEEQHKDELESYREELDKWQSEVDSVRKQLSENRMLLTKGNISLMKELQERDDKIHELSLACQQLQNEIDLMESTNRQQVIVQPEPEAKLYEIVQTVSRDQLQHQSQTDLLRKQLQSLMEKEKTYKHEISDLKQQLSRRYMAVKTQEKKASQREVQLERKVKSLEEELHKVRAQLDQEYLAQEAKKAKTAEELALWEKQKKWQQTAEKLKDKLKEKSDECAKLLSNYEKLRSVVSCLEREKWYLKSKLKGENENVAGSPSTRPILTAQQNLVEELQNECQILRGRIKELTDRLEREDTGQLLRKMKEQEKHIAALDAVTQGNTYVISQLEKLEMARDILEKSNIKLESENFELRLELEKVNAETPRLREKVEHLEKYIELLKVEKLSDSTPRSSDKDLHEHGLKKTSLEMEKTIFTLKRIIEKLQAENKRLKIVMKKTHILINQGKTLSGVDENTLQRQYEQAQKRVVDLETDLQLAEQRITMLEKAQKDDDNGQLRILKQQLMHKSELLDRVKQLLTRAAINEKSLRQRVQQLESKQQLSMIPECFVTPPTPE